MTLLLFVLLTTALYYLGAWATITRRLRDLLPDAAQAFTFCAACSGFWYGLAVNAAGARLHLVFLGLPCAAWYTYPLVGLGALVWTPLIATIHIGALNHLQEIAAGNEAGNKERT